MTALNEIIIKIANFLNKAQFFILSLENIKKNYLHKNLAAFYRYKGKIILNVAFASIVATLFTKNKTAYLIFNFPIKINELSTCRINLHFKKAVLIKKTWNNYDEAPKKIN